jgi:energy-coupling factor transport system ATP-binding protein
MIRVENLTVRYGDQVALDDVNLEIAPGEFVLLTGPSGCGKSTLARALNGLIPYASSARMTGRVVVDGVTTTDHSVAELAAHVGLVFQRPTAQLFCLTAEEEVACGPRNLGMDEDKVSQRVKFAVEAMGIEHLRGRRVSELSGGEQQRVAIAAVLSMRPTILVLDEPTSSLDWTGTAMLFSSLARLRREYGLTIVMIEHRLAEAAQLADRVIVMDGGRVVSDGAPGEILYCKELLARLGMRYPWHVLDGPIQGCASAAEEIAGENWPAVLPVRQSQAQPPVGRPENSQPLVELRGIEAGYGRAKVLRGLDLALYPGEFAALVGDNGAGKSTVGRVLAGLLRPRRGRVVWRGKRDRILRVGLVLQDPLVQLFCDTVEDEVAFGPRNLGRFAPQDVEQVLTVAGLTVLRRRSPYALSCGQQQRTALAAILALKPELLILDEPTLGQDWGHLSRIMDFLIELNGQGLTLLVITHDYKLICHYARRILVLSEGRIVADGAPRLPVSIETRQSAQVEARR